MFYANLRSARAFLIVPRPMREITVAMVFAVLLPPLAVYLRRGFYSYDFLVCVLLTILGYLPGVVYAVCTVLKTNEVNLYSGSGDLPD